MTPRRPLTVSGPGGKLVDSSLVILNCHSQLTVHLRPGLLASGLWGLRLVPGTIGIWDAGLKALRLLDCYEHSLPL